MLVTITNVSNQVIPVLVNSTTLGNSNAQSDIEYFKSQSTAIAPGAELNVERERVDLAQLEQLRRLGTISFVTR
jgi:hypothetical protein